MNLNPKFHKLLHTLEHLLLFYLCKFSLYYLQFLHLECHNLNSIYLHMTIHNLFLFHNLVHIFLAQEQDTWNLLGKLEFLCIHNIPKESYNNTHKNIQLHIIRTFSFTSPTIIKKFIS